MPPSPQQQRQTAQNWEDQFLVREEPPRGADGQIGQGRRVDGPQTLEGYVSAAMTGLQRGAAAVVGFPRQITDWGGDLADMAVEGGRHLAGLPQEEIDRRAQRDREFDAAHPELTQSGVNMFPRTQDVDTAFQSVTGPYHEPQNRGERYTETIASMAPAALAPGGPMTRAARVVIPGAASEAAGEATEGTPLEPWARAGGAVAGGFGVSAGEYLANAPNRVLSAAVAGATDADMVAAQQLQERAAQQGVRLTRAEALEQVTHGGSGMQDAQDLVESSRHGARTIRPFFRDRPAETAAAVEGFANRVAPPTPDPSMIGQRGQQVAGEIIDDTRRGINAQAEPNYQALQQEHMDPADFQVLAQDPAFTRALAAVRGDPILNKGLEGLPDTNLSVINRVVQQAEQMSENALPNPSRDTGSHFESSQYAGAGRDASAAASRSSATFQQPSNWDTARNTVRQGHEQILDPIEAGPVGAMSRTGDTGAQTRALFPAAPLAGGADETERAIQLIAGADPELASALARQHVLAGRTGIAEQGQALAGGENQFGMARWAANLAANPEQRAALLRGFRALPNGDALSSELADLIEVGHATGRRAAANSRTAIRTDYQEQMKRVVPEWLKVASDFAYGGRMEALADFLIGHPSETAQALRAARSRGQGFTPPLAEAVLSAPRKDERKPEVVE